MMRCGLCGGFGAVKSRLVGEVSGRSSRGLMESHYARRRWRACIMIREAAAGAEENAKDFDARALRIGGATDLYHLFTANEAERIISDRGRWKSDIKDLYSRLSATSTLESSAIMADAKGVDLEAFRHGYVMPAVVRRRGSRHV